ncbi:MAG: peroxiredoxin family protein [Lishizhenia sp.]
MIQKITALFLLSTVLFSCSSTDQTKKENNAKTTPTQKSDTVNQVIKEEKDNVTVNNNFTVAGKIENGIHAKLNIEANTQQGAIVLATTYADDEGNFNIKGSIADMGIYQLRLVENVKTQNAEKAVPLTLDVNDSVYIKVDFENFNQAPEYSGTLWAEQLNGYFAKLFDFIEFQRNLQNPEKMDQTKLVALIEKNKIPLDNYCRNAINKHPENPANLILMKELYPIEYLGGFENWDGSNIKVLKKMQDGFNRSYPSNPISSQIIMQVNQLESGYNEFLSFEGMKVAPEISMKDPNGKTRKLSDLRGKIVLIDFWASWCGPCRRENPNVVKMYNKYKNKGFEIFSVSLDKDANAWKRAISSDELIWDNHVSDLQGWNSSVVSTYKFQGIPYTVLIDTNGEIIEKGLRGAALERKLETLLK